MLGALGFENDRRQIEAETNHTSKEDEVGADDNAFGQLIIMCEDTKLSNRLPVSTGPTIDHTRDIGPARHDHSHADE